ncbi:MAG: OmpH family outer membrane protein [Gammaproteobacteria bacterium]|nr:OmpH family outer membrane protein [Gammaproteobacteria bacterium]
MLKKIVIVVWALLVVQVPGYAASVKIAYVNTVKVIEDAPQSKAALKKLEAEFKPRDKELVDLQNQIKASEDKLEKDALVMKASERRDIERELLTMKRNLRRATQEFREDYNLRRNEELASLQKLIAKVITEIAKAENYDLVVHEGAMYASSKVDITDKVLRKLGK